MHIGSDENPHLGAVLDVTNPNEQGLLLPNVKLTNVDVWQPVPGVAADGMVVFSDGSGGLIAGIYIWNNGKWRLLTGNTDGAVTGVTVNPTTLNFTTTTTQILIPIIAPAEAVNRNVTWNSSDESVATVSSSGVVAPVNNGTATITVKTDNGSKTATCQVNVNLSNYTIIGGAYAGPSTSTLNGSNSGKISTTQFTDFGFSSTGDLELSALEAISSYSWEQAQTTCNALGSNWRLPNIAELSNLYSNKDTYWFYPNSYWTSTER
ncbi:hypothetical protein FACS189413_06570 [Bacteroidia bacterium]|nr:hypothetical protein FACS189413_06570 [Bacteroidia bacterium]